VQGVGSLGRARGAPALRALKEQKPPASKNYVEAWLISAEGRMELDKVKSCLELNDIAAHIHLIGYPQRDLRLDLEGRYTLSNLLNPLLNCRLRPDSPRKLRLKMVGDQNYYI